MLCRAWLRGARGVCSFRRTKYEQEETLGTASACSLALPFMLRSASLGGRGREDPNAKAPVLCRPQGLALLPPSSAWPGSGALLSLLARPAVRPTFFCSCGTYGLVHVWDSYLSIKV